MSAVQDVLVWWVAQMRGLMPARWRSRDGQGDGLVAEVSPGSAAYRLVQRRRGKETRLSPVEAAARLARRPAPAVALRVPPGVALERPLVLPIATEPELDRVVAYEIDRISPFQTDEAAWAYAVERRDTEAGRLHLRLALLPRAGVAAAVAALREAGAAPAAVIAPRTGGGAWSISLAQQGALPRSARPWQRRAVAAAGAACAILALAAMAGPFVTQEAALRREEARIAALRPAVATADGLRRTIAGRASGLDAVASEAARVGQVLQVLATLTDVLPDDTYLTALTLRARTLTLSGRSGSASRLIPLLAAEPALRGAAFAAPVTRVEGARGDVFSIRAEYGS